MIRVRWIGLLTMAIMVFAMAIPVACRDDVSPFQPRDRETDPDATMFRLTASPGDDRVPAWSPAGDSVYYTAEGFGHLPQEPGVLVGLPRTGGVTRPILHNVQTTVLPGRQQWYAGPAPAPKGRRLAFAVVASLWPSDPCSETAVLSCTPSRDSVPLPPLRQILLRVRGLDELGPLGDDPAVSLFVPGVILDAVVIPMFGAIPRYNVRYHPGQRLFADERAFVFRASWSPDGDRIAFSDGENLRIWKVGDQTAPAVSNTEGAIWAAWSPDGDWIAFTRTSVVDSTHTSCAYLAPLGICAFVEYTELDAGPVTLTLVRPDGSELRELGAGWEPAWSPDGGALYYRDDGRIWRIDVNGTNSPEAIPNTEGGREPAVSPDGRFLAFARRPPGQPKFDIWVVELQ